MERYQNTSLALALAALFAALPVMAPGEDGDEAAWSALRSGGHVALLRHALAPGTGDPPGFTIGDCTTQRNLSESGRHQASAIGARFREAGLEGVLVYSSQWCRCLDTAELLALGPVEELSSLNSFFQQPDQRDTRLRNLRAWLTKQDMENPVVLVTHQVTVTALTGYLPASGEVVVVRVNENGTFSVVATVQTQPPGHLSHRR